MIVGWTYKNIEEISKVVNGYSFKSKDFSADNEIKSIKITNVGIMEFNEDSANNLPSIFLKENAKVRVHEGDIVLALTRTIISGGLKVARVPKSYNNSLLNQRVAAIIPNLDLVNSDYLYYYFSSDIVYNYVLDNVNTLMQPNLSIGDLKKMNVPICSLPEQKQIVTLLDKTFETIDQAKANIEKNIENAKELFQSKLNNIFNQKGEGWEEKTILELCEHKSQIVGGPFGSNLKVKDYKDAGVPILRLQNIGKGYFIDKNIKYINDEKAKELDYHSFVSGDIALAKLGIPIGKTCIIPEKFKYGIVTADVVRIRPNKENINYSFLKHFLNSQSAVQQLTDDITGATRPRVNIAEVRNLKLSVPSNEQQISLNKIIDGLEADINHVITNYEKKNIDLDDLKKSILQKAFAGELTNKTVEV